jgi:hypothetical protein
VQMSDLLIRTIPAPVPCGSLHSTCDGHAPLEQDPRSNERRSRATCRPH